MAYVKPAPLDAQYERLPNVERDSGSQQGVDDARCRLAVVDFTEQSASGRS
jgi:hypothetical protein